MKNKIISLMVVVSLFGVNINAAFFEERSSTSYSQWTDPSTNMTYTNFGSVNFRFKRNNTHFAPWVKASPPQVKAGCGGVSLDAGFAAFLDLETIGKQLEQAISSVGMGVVVVLIQTLPSIGKAFEDIQKLVRKIQSMLQNACQMTVQGLSNDPLVMDLKKNMQDDVQELWGNSAVAKGLEGVDSFLDATKDVLTCDSNDQKCLENLKQHLQTDVDPTSSKGKSKIAFQGVESDVAKAISKIITQKLPANLQVKTDTYKNVLGSGKFDGTAMTMTQEERTGAILRIAMFGYIAIDEGDTILGSPSVDSSGNANIQAAAESIAKPNDSTKVYYMSKFHKSVVKDSDLADFLLGRNLTGTQTNTVSIRGDVKFAVETWAVGGSSKTGGTSSEFSKFIYSMEPAVPGTDTVDITWAGIKQAGYETILHAVDSNKFSAPTNPIGVYMPNGNKYVQYIRNYTEDDDVEKYADLLAKINTKYAIEALVREAKEYAIDNNGGSVTGEEKQKYFKYIDDRAKMLIKELEDYSGDIIYLNNFEQVFENMKQLSLQKKMKGTKQ